MLYCFGLTREQSMDVQ